MVTNVTTLANDYQTVISTYNLTRIDFDIEGGWQFGNFESNRLDAWFFAAEAGYTFADLCYSPRASVGLDIASGSPDATNRFNQLFPPTYMYLGHLYLFGRPNLIDCASAAHPRPTSLTSGQFSGFRRGPIAEAYVPSPRQEGAPQRFMAGAHPDAQP